MNQDDFVEAIAQEQDYSGHRGYDSNRVRAEKCKSCPWREGSAGEHLRPMLEARVLTETNHYCHSQQLQGKAPDVICRGARDLQIGVFHRMGVLSEATDECWAKTLERLNGE